MHFSLRTAVLRLDLHILIIFKEGVQMNGMPQGTKELANSQAQSGKDHIVNIV